MIAARASTGRTHRSLAVFGCILASVVCLVPPARARAGDPAAGGDPLQAHKYMGVIACARCHREPTPEDRSAKVTDFVALTEYATWSTRDPHHAAHAALGGERARRMGELLGYDVSADRRCVSCHAIDTVPERREPTFSIERGVSCEACHGPSSDWVDAHWKPGWRERAPAEKERAGMTDVRDAGKRTKLCLSCHLGDAEQGKLVTHEMYAAGHPPLPSVEPMSLLARMPAHWRPLAQKPRAIQQQFGFRPQPFPQTREATASSVIVLRESLRLAGDCGTRSLDGQAAGLASAWPELAVFDCRACHHELESPSWRQARGFAGPPGRPTLPAWPAEIALLVSSPPVAAALKPAHESLGRRPFGEAATFAKAASAAVAGLEDVLVTVRDRPGLDAADARALAKEACRAGAAGSRDFDSARQLVCLVRVIHDELAAVDPHPPRDAKAEAILTALEGDLAISREAAIVASGEQRTSAYLAAARRYDPRLFATRMKELAELMKDPGP
jgi:hypothetical protein